MGYATAGSEAQVNEYLVLRLQQQADLPISMPTSSAAFATLQIVVANFLFQSGMSLHNHLHILLLCNCGCKTFAWQQS
jgi:hypothetical protein